ncbi:MAG: FtsX-like permease family protein [Candidatus Poribacteria bacterium]|nr:FtsX-like permease family protein [Candidatus Poribacteria bacterium]
MAQQTQGTIGQQIQLPFMESVRISFQSLMIRFGRSVITTAGITLGIAFLVSVLADNEITLAMQESGAQEEIASFDEEEPQGISTKDIWLIIMSLIVCVVGIANSMLMAVTERFQEIGTMKCLGALDRYVVRLFLLESGFQGLAGALIGSLIGCIASMLLGLKDYGLDLFFYFPLLPVLRIILFGCVLGMILAILGAALPAWRAAKLPPAEAMRTEV